MASVSDEGRCSQYLPYPPLGSQRSQVSVVRVTGFLYLLSVVSVRRWVTGSVHLGTERIDSFKTRGLFKTSVVPIVNPAPPPQAWFLKYGLLLVQTCHTNQDHRSCLHLAKAARLDEDQTQITLATIPCLMFHRGAPSVPSYRADEIDEPDPHVGEAVLVHAPQEVRPWRQYLPALGLKDHSTKL